MAYAIPINKAVATTMQQSQLPAPTDPWREATQAQQSLAHQRELLLRPILEHQQRGASLNVAIRNLLQHIKTAPPDSQLAILANTLGRKGKPPSRSTLIDWANAFSEQGRAGLLPKHTGRVRQDKGWEALAIQLYNIPSKPSYSAVAARLREEHGFTTATDAAVRRYLKTMPSTLGAESPLRMGKHKHQQDRGRYVMRDTSVLRVGEVYEGDGHTVDCYLAHPNSGAPWRPELTVWIDVRSKYIVGWYLSDAESTQSTLFALSHALLSNDHMPAWVHIDNGSGFKNKLMSDKAVGFYERMSISTTVAIPGNSRGKGLVEHWFRTFRDHHDKFFNGGADYCGNDMAEEANRRISDLVKRGKRQLRAFVEYRDSVAAFINAYNNRLTKTLDGESPAQLWQQLERVPVVLHAEAVIRPQVERVAQRCTISLHGRKYEHRALAHYERHKVRVEYDLHVDDKVWVFDPKNRLICTAELKTKVAWLPESRIEEAREKREAGRIKRLQDKIERVKAEESSSITADEQVAALERWDANDDQPPPPASGIKLDLTEDIWGDDDE